MKRGCTRGRPHPRVGPRRGGAGRDLREGALRQRPVREERADDEGAGEGPAVVDGLVRRDAARARGGAPREEGHQQVVLAEAQRQQRLPAPVPVGARAGRGGVDGERPARRGGLGACEREARRGGQERDVEQRGGPHGWVGGSGTRCRWLEALFIGCAHLSGDRRASQPFRVLLH